MSARQALSLGLSRSGVRSYQALTQALDALAEAGTSVCLTPEANTGDAFKPTVLMDRVIKFLESQPDQTAGSMTAITDSVSGKASYVRQAVRALIGEGLVVESAGSTRGTKYTLKDSVSANPSRPPYRGGTDRTDSIATRGRIGTDWDGFAKKPGTD